MDEKKEVFPRGPRPLTPEHRRLLRMKAYSFPFLCEKSWNNCDEYDDEGRREDLIADEVIHDGGISDLEPRLHFYCEKCDIAQEWSDRERFLFHRTNLKSEY